MNFFIVRFYHAGMYVGQEVIRAIDEWHARRLATYIGRTFVRLEGIEPSGTVTFDIIPT